MQDPDPHREQDVGAPRAALIGVLICLLLVLGGLLLVYEFKRMSAIQDCAMQGRTNCTSGDGL